MDESLQSHFTVKGEIKARFWSSNKASRILLATAGLLGFVPSANELWLTNEDGFFSRFTSLSEGIAFACTFSFLLFVFYCMNWYRITKAVSDSMPAYAFLSAVFDILAMTIVVFGVYFAIGEITLETLNISWKLLYLVVPLAIGDFALTSIVTRLLRKAAEIERDLQDSEKAFQQLVERSKKSPKLKPPTRPRKSKIIAEFLGEDSESEELIHDER